MRTEEEGVQALPCQTSCSTTGILLFLNPTSIGPAKFFSLFPCADRTECRRYLLCVWEVPSYTRYTRRNPSVQIKGSNHNTRWCFLVTHRWILRCASHSSSNVTFLINKNAVTFWGPSNGSRFFPVHVHKKHRTSRFRHRISRSRALYLPNDDRSSRKRLGRADITRGLPRPI